MSKLTGKVAVVTGASKGIGAAISKALAAEGASVVVNYASSKEGADKVVAAIVADGGTAIAVQGDVSKSADVEKLFGAVKAEYGKVDVLVNNAGVYQFAPVEGTTEAEFLRQFGTNVLGPLLAISAASTLFPAEGGSIINIGSGVTRIHPPNSAIYTGTKGALDAITQVLAKELGPRRIRVNSINPGLTETEGTHTAGFVGSDFFAAMVAQTPLGRMGQPEDIAKIAVFLASDDAGWVTAETIIAGGGLR